jgi:hypothetical protein
VRERFPTVDQQGRSDVAQPYQIYDSKGGGRSFGRRPIVLARLPHVGAEARPAECSPVAAQSSAFSRGTRFYVDAQHTRSPVGERANVRKPDRELQPTSHHRHHGPHHRPSSEQAIVDRGTQFSVATQLSEWHRRLTSYSGLIVTLALAASAALLYWMIIAPSQRPLDDFGNAYDAFGATKVEIPQFEFPSAPPAEHHVESPVPSADPFSADRLEQSREDVPAAVVAQQTPARSDTPPTTTDGPATSETSAPLLEPGPELVPLPEENDEPEPDYNDASVRAYPTTEHPLAWDLTKLGTAEVAAAGEAAAFSAPETARQPAPTATFQ